MNVPSRFYLLLALAPLAAGQTPPKFRTDVLALHPIGYWHLGGNLNDISGNGNNGSVNQGGNVPFLVGPALGTPGAGCCGAANFTNGSFVLVPGNAFNLGTTHPLTVLAWIRTVQVQGDIVGLVVKYDPGASIGWGLVMDNGGFSKINGAGRPTFVLQNGDATLAVETNAAVNDGYFHLVAATYDGSGLASGVQLYIDGMRMSTTTILDTLGGASVVNTAPLTIGDSVDDKLRFEGSIGHAVVFGSALTSDQIAQLAADSTLGRAVLPQFAFGGGWYSALYFKNGGSASPVSFQVNFVDDHGNPLTVPSVGGSSTTVTLARGGSAVIEAPNTGDLAEGYVWMDLPAGVAGYGVFRQTVPGIHDQEAVVPMIWAYGSNNSLIFDDTSALTAFAMVNPSNVEATITITAYDVDGTQLGTYSTSLGPLNKTEGVLSGLPGLAAVAGHRGNVVFTTSTGSVAVLGLRFNGAAFSSIPATVGYQFRRFPGEN